MSENYSLLLLYVCVCVRAQYQGKSSSQFVIIINNLIIFDNLHVASKEVHVCTTLSRLYVQEQVSEWVKLNVFTTCLSIL